jgi:hypothetical protein
MVVGIFSLSWGGTERERARESARERERERERVGGLCFLEKALFGRPTPPGDGGGDGGALPLSRSERYTVDSDVAAAAIHTAATSASSGAAVAARARLFRFFLRGFRMRIKLKRANDLVKRTNSPSDAPPPPRGDSCIAPPRPDAACKKHK